MTKKQVDINGLALISSNSGVIQEVIQDDLNLTDQLDPESLLSSLVPSSEFNKVMHFLSRINSSGYTGRWEINTKSAGGIIVLNFTGCSLGSGNLVVSTTSMENLPGYFNRIIHMLPGYDGVLDTNLEKLSHSVNEALLEGVDLTDEMSRLNNELVNAQRELHRKNIQLEKLNELKNRFLGLAAHDLRNPLSLVTLYNELLLDSLKDRLDEDQKMIFTTIHSSLQHMFELVEDFLDLSVIESGHLKINPEEDDIMETISQSVQLNQAIAAKKGITINLHPDENEVILSFDRRRILQVLNNLLSNAIKFSHRDSSIMIKTEQLIDQFEIRVIDHGTGISDPLQERLFQPFHKEGSTGTDGEPSTGLGLWIVKNIMNEHGGTVRFENNDGPGTTFILALPL